MGLFRRNQPPTRATAAMRELLDELDRLGFYRSCTPAAVAAARARALADGYLFEIETSRTFFADAEAIAEGGVGDFVEGGRPFLDRAGVAVPRIVEVPAEPDYVVRVGDVDHTIYVATQADSAYLWALAQARAMRIVNHILAAGGSDERVYALIAGNNDSIAVFLTPAMHAAIAAATDVHKCEVPISADDLEREAIAGMTKEKGWRAGS